MKQEMLFKDETFRCDTEEYNQHWDNETDETTTGTQRLYRLCVWSDNTNHQEVNEEAGRDRDKTGRARQRDTSFGVVCVRLGSGEEYTEDTVGKDRAHTNIERERVMWVV